jgi:Zn-dependent peptidase ImmA (M78 family)/transcriptional regulator with XRE-family HTH domain
MIDEAIGARIREAREAVGLSQQAVAERLGYASAATVSYLEAGERRITVADLQALSGVLGVSLSYFLEALPAPDVPQQLSLRATVVEPAARRALTEFLAFAQKRSVSVPLRPVSLASAKPGAAATAILRKTGSTEPPIDPTMIARKLGVSVLQWRFPEEISGVLAYYGDRATIGVNSAHASVRQRFTIAHEIGHFVYAHEDELILDYSGRERGFSFDSDVSGPEEIKANQFAADLLMPWKWVQNAFAEHGSDLPLLANRFDVSEQAIWFRLRNLKLVTAE